MYARFWPILYNHCFTVPWGLTLQAAVRVNALRGASRNLNEYIVVFAARDGPVVYGRHIPANF